MKELGSSFLKKSQIKKFKKAENQCQNAACEQTTTSEKKTFGSNKKLGLERTMSELRKPIRKNSQSKQSKKTLKSK